MGFGWTSRCTYYLCTKTPLVVQFQICCYEKEEERNGFWWNNNFFDSCPPPAHTDLPACSLSENKSTKFFGEVSRHHLTTPPAPTRAWKRHATWTVLVLLMPEAVLPPLLPLFQLLHSEDWRCCPGFSIKCIAMMHRRQSGFDFAILSTTDACILYCCPFANNSLRVKICIESLSKQSKSRQHMQWRSNQTEWCRREDILYTK